MSAELFTFSIDDSDTREIDDAFSVALSETGFALHIHITNVANIIKKEDALDEAAYEKATTVYLPSGTIYMLPEDISCEAASLLENVPRDTISLILQFDNDFNLQRWDLGAQKIVSQKKTHL